MVFQKIIFQNRYVELQTPPPSWKKTILNFHFDYLTTSLRTNARTAIFGTNCILEFQSCKFLALLKVASKYYLPLHWLFSEFVIFCEIKKGTVEFCGILLVGF